MTTHIERTGRRPMSLPVYIYVLREKGSPDVRYVGQTENPKRRRWEHLRGRKTSISRWRADVYARGGEVEFEIVATTTWREAKRIEMELLLKHKDTALNPYGRCGIPGLDGG